MKWFITRFLNDTTSFWDVVFSGQLVFLFQDKTVVMKRGREKEPASDSPKTRTSKRQKSPEIGTYMS
jgi:hypothetical protein